MKDKKFIKLTPFKMQVLQSFPFIDEDFDAITNYELLCKVVEYLNKTVDNVDLLNEKVEEFENYFNNLDVQEEINNKLDEMAEDGTLADIINQDLLATINQNVTNNTNNIIILQNKQNITDGAIQDINDTNLVQSSNIAQLQINQNNNVKKNESNSVSMDMLTNEVKEALTGGSTAVVGANSVGTTELKNSGVTILKLSDLLQKNFRLKYTPVNLGTANDNTWYAIAGGNLTSNTASAYKGYIVPLTKGKIYRVVGVNYSSGFKTLTIGTNIGESASIQSPSGTEIHSEYSGIAANYYYTDMIFQCDNDNLKGYMNQIKSTANNMPHLLTTGIYGLYEVELIETYTTEQPHDNYVAIDPMKTLSNTYISNGVASNIRNPYRMYSLNAHTLKIFQLKSGTKYKVTGTQIYHAAGLQLYTRNGEFIYASLGDSNPQSPTSYSYEWTASDDGFAIIQNTNNTSSVLFEAMLNTTGYNSYKKINGKKILYNGDSITQSRLNTSNVNYNGGAYPKIISDLTGSSYVNYSIGGGTLASATGGYRIVNEIANMDNDADAIIFSGGINDYWQNIPLGSYTPNDYTGNVDITTVSGALEKIFRDSINKWIGKPILFVITHKIYNTAYTQNSAGYTFEELHDRIVAICNKYSIPYYDCYKDGGLNSYMSIMNTTFMTAGNSGQPDYTHPNEEAYKIYYVPQVIDLINKNLKN